MRCRSLAIALALLTLKISVTLAQTEPRVALVIGNSDYLNVSKLRNPANDATAMAKTLRTLGFDVIERENATRRAMIQAMRTFGGKLSPGNIGLLFYSGHGVQAQGANYLLPTDVILSTEDDLKYEAIDVQDILTKLTDARVRLSVIILDACRDNPFVAFRSGTRGLMHVDPPRGTVVAYSTSPGAVAADGDGTNSIYTSELIKAMGQPGWKLMEVFEHVTDAVERQTNNAQTPWVNSSFRGDFYFLGPTTVTVQSPGQLDLADVTFWLSIVASTKPADFQAYLARFPQGSFIPLAKERLATLLATQWPQFQPSLKPGEAQGPLKAELPADLEMVPPGPDVPPPIRDLSGRWSGWASRNRSVSIQIAVERLGELGGQITFAVASSQEAISPQAIHVKMRLVNGNELQGDIPGAQISLRTVALDFSSASITIRMRADGNMDCLLQENGGLMAGILSRSPG